MPSLTGKYVMEKSENFDEYMKILGVGMVMRKMANVTTPTVEVTLDGDTYSLKTISTLKTTDLKFKLGEEFEETTADGRVVKAKLTLDGMVLTHNQIGNKDKKEKDSVLIRTFKDDGFGLECKCENVVSTRFYKRQ